jgi:hypothetical protein
MVSGPGLHKQKAPSFMWLKKWGFIFFCNTIAGHVILLFEVQKTDLNKSKTLYIK